MNRYSYYCSSCDRTFLDKEYGGNPKPIDYGLTSRSIADYEDKMDRLVKTEPDSGKIGKNIFICCFSVIVVLFLVQSFAGIYDDILLLLSLGLPTGLGFVVFYFLLDRNRKKIMKIYEIVRSSNID